MADNIPTPPSYQQILGQMLDSVQSRVGFKGPRIGGPLLSILEAAAQSDLRSSQDVFQLSDATSLDRATGHALDLIGTQNDVPRQPATPAVGYVDIIDTSFVKASSVVYAGSSAPIAGTTTIDISDGGNFPTSGSVYLGRGTTNLEGPIAYSSINKLGAFWRITLSSPTTKFHNIGEGVVLSSGGTRLVQAGTTCQTAQASGANAIKFQTVFSATIPDGETTASNVLVVCAQPGIVGNVQQSSIVEVTGLSFTASCNNALPFDNGTDIEPDDLYRERIRDAMQTRQKGTSLAIKSAAVGVVAPDEAKRSVSASVVVTPTTKTLYIDDGTGYEERTAGAAKEVLVESALGGEDLFQLQHRPVTLAQATSTATAPYALADQMVLSVLVGSTVYEHTFSADDFRDISNATAFEVVSSINANSTLGVSARTANGGNQVVLFPKNGPSDLQVRTPSQGTDANTIFLFPTAILSTLRLYKNSQLLFQNGAGALITSAPQGSWSTISTGATLIIDVDGTGNRTYTFVDNDFLGTGYGTVAKTNSVASWATVINKKVAGVTATAVGAQLVLTSNRGNSALASLVIDGTSTLVATSGMFSADSLSGVGENEDYTLDQSSGQIQLLTALAENDNLIAGTDATNAYLNSIVIPGASLTLAATAKFFVVADAPVQIVSTGITTTTSMVGATATVTGYGSITYNWLTWTAAAATFTGAQVGDYLVLWDPAFTVPTALRVAHVANDGSVLYTDRLTDASMDNIGTFIPTKGGFAVLRTSGLVQRISISSGTYTLDQMVTALNAVLVGCTAMTINNNSLRISTNTRGSEGAIMYVGGNTEAAKLGFTEKTSAINLVSHLATLESVNPEISVPDMFWSGNAIDGLSRFVRWMRPYYNNAGPNYAYGSNVGDWQYMTLSSPLTFVPKPTSLVYPGAQVDYRYWPTRGFEIAPNDNLVVTLDDNLAGETYNVPLSRQIQPQVGQTYGTTFIIRDTDNAGTPISTAWGTAFNFANYAIFMRARGKTHATSAANKAILWRAVNPGPHRWVIEYDRPTAPNADLAVVQNNFNIGIKLASGAARTGTGILNSTRFLVSAPDTHTLVFTYARKTITTLSRNGTTSVVTVDLGAAKKHNVVIGDIIYLNSGDIVNFPSGAKRVATVPNTQSFTYIESGGNVTAGGVNSLEWQPTAPTLTAGSVTVGDIVTLGSGIEQPGTDWNGSWRVTAVGAETFTIKQGAPGTYTAPDTSSEYPYKINDTTNITFFPITAKTAAQIVTFVNGATSGLQGIITAVAVEDGGGSPGTGTITKSSEDANIDGDSTTKPLLVDGINDVVSLNMSTGLITLRTNPDATLTGALDFNNERMWLVPKSSAQLAAFISAPAISGIYTTGILSAVNKAGHLQLATQLPGTAGAIHITGGYANVAEVSVVGTGTSFADFSTALSFARVMVPTSQIQGFVPGQYVNIEAATTQPKTIDSLEGLSLTINNIDATTFEIVRSAGTFFTQRSTPVTGSQRWHIERHGDFTLYAWYGVGATPSLIAPGNVKQGDWIWVSVAGMNPANTGWFRAVQTPNFNYSAVANLFLWVYNPNGVEEEVTMNGTTDFIRAFSYDSAIPGDFFVIPDTVQGVANQGSWVIESIDFAQSARIRVTSSTMTAHAITGVGSGFALYRVVEGKPFVITKLLYSINTIPDTPAYSWMNFRTDDNPSKMTASTGCAVKALGKLAFDTDLTRGLDGYNYYTGLIGEVSKVIFGDNSDPITYPGVSAAGTTIDIHGPLVKRVEVALAIRLRSSLNTKEISDRVRGAVASTINRTPVGQSVSLAAIVAAAQRIDGVMSVVLQSPAYTVTNDLIQVQPNEKPLVMNVDTDISITIIGG